jgi:two-component system phosphate regulon sensor histidine kinase PhoR
VRRTRLFWLLCTPVLLLLLAALLLSLLESRRALEALFAGQARDAFAEDVRDAAPRLARLLATATTEELARAAEPLLSERVPGVDLLDAEGRPLASAGAPPPFPARPDAPAVLEALAHRRPAAAVRYSRQAGGLLEIVVPLRTEERTTGAVRTLLSTHALAAARGESLRRHLLIGLLALGAGGLLALALARRLRRPLESFRRGADAFGRGDLYVRVTLDTPAEFRQLGESLNEMAAHLEERFRQVVRERNEQLAVLRSMVEGVLAVDLDQRILNLNQAAADFLLLRRRDALGRAIMEVVRNVELQDFVTLAVTSGQDEGLLERDIPLRRAGAAGPRVLRVRGTPLLDAAGERIGALLVLQDVTQIRRLETIRRDFVANVSHELRTPITGIKGFVETLQDSVGEDPARTAHFLTIISRQADRLNAIIEDLLSLSRIERESESQAIVLESGPLRPVLESAVETCQMKAQEKELAVELACPPDLHARMSPHLLEQAVVNLLDNAIKYSEPGTGVAVQAHGPETGPEGGPEVVLAVRDHGIGIEPRHIPRLFERFYRVDKARSRELGGTGLGLSIVKHITLSHGGRVSVESTPGEGSVFRIHLPLG